jgi:integrase
LAFSAETVSPITQALYRRYLLRLAGEFGEWHLEALTPAGVRAWGRTYHAVQAVQRLASWAFREARLIACNPLAGMRKMSRGRRLRVLTRGEAVRLLRFAGPHFRALLVAMRESRARPGEIRRATWGDVKATGMQPATDNDLRAGRAFVFLGSFKSQSVRDDRFAVRVIPISRRLGRLLARLRMRSRDSTGPIFCNRLGRAWTVNAVLCRLRRLRLAAGVDRDHRGENAVAYSLRHTGATRAIVAGIDLATLAAIMGHADVRMTARYVHLCPDHLAKALGRVAEVKGRFAKKSDVLGSLRNASDGAS